MCLCVYKGLKHDMAFRPFKSILRYDWDVKSQQRLVYENITMLSVYYCYKNLIVIYKAQIYIVIFIFN